jgi:hypothetical protein
VARILIVGGGCPGRRLAARLVGDGAGGGHAVRVTTRTEAGRGAIEAAGAECWIGTPDRLATMRGALEHVTVACWMLARAHGEEEHVAALHGSRLEFFLGQAIDTTVRGLVYEPAGAGVPAGAAAAGAEIAARLTERNRIPAAMLEAADRADLEAWLVGARAAVEGLLAEAAR